MDELSTVFAARSVSRRRNRCRIVGVSVVDSMQVRDMILASGMETGVIDGYEKLDALLAD